MVAIWSPLDKAWRFGIMNECPFGLGSVVVTFNRYPTLTTAFQRRILGLLSGAYFDDVLLLDLACSSQRAKHLLGWSFEGLGTPSKPSKSFPMSSHRALLGAMIDLNRFNTDGIVDIAPK